jgi:hypothetical protein
MKPTYVYAATCVKVIDGDTYDLLVDLGFRAFEKVRVRLRGYNAPEMSTQEGRLARLAALDILDPPYRRAAAVDRPVLQGPALLRALDLRRVDARRHAAGRRAGAGEGMSGLFQPPGTAPGSPLRCAVCGRFLSLEAARRVDEVGDFGVVLSYEFQCRRHRP